MGESGTGQDCENARKKEQEEEKASHSLAQSAAEPVTVSVQPLHSHHTQTPFPIPEWDWGTSGSHNGDYLQPQWGNDTKMPLARETGETERWRERERLFRIWHEEGEWQRREEKTRGWPFLPSDRGRNAGGGWTPYKHSGSFPWVSKPLLRKCSAS